MKITIKTYKIDNMSIFFSYNNIFHSEHFGRRCLSEGKLIKEDVVNIEVTADDLDCLHNKLKSGLSMYNLLDGLVNTYMLKQEINNNIQLLERMYNDEN